MSKHLINFKGRQYFCHSKLVLITALLLSPFYLSNIPSQVSAQIVPDSTLSRNSIVTPNGNTVNIAGGSEVGRNLFHSFQQFSLSNGNTAFFHNSANIENIITRVTGNSISRIDGLIRANGNANLFLINPNGIIFGTNAALNLGGSFVASTANTIKFDDGAQFSTVNPQSAPLLTVSAPIGLEFGINPGTISNRSQTIVPAVSQDPNSPPFLKVGLQVQPQKTLGLIGGDISIDGGYITAPQGRIELGSVRGRGQVSILPTDDGLTFGYAGINNFGDIQLANQAKVDASGLVGGAISVQSKNLNITNSSRIESNTLGEGLGKPILINATDSINISQGNLFVTEGESVLNLPLRLSAIAASVLGNGRGGDIHIQAQRLLVRDGGRIVTGNGGLGQSGNLSIHASKSIEIIGVANLIGGNPAPPDFPVLGSAAQLPDNFTTEVFTLSGLLIQGFAFGTFGQLSVDTGHLTIKGGGVVSTSSFGQGKGGNIDIRVAGLIDIDGISPRNASPGGIFTTSFGVGNAGDLTMQTKQLNITGGGEVAASAAAGGDAGNVRITATDTIKLIGKSANQFFPSGLLAQSVGNGNAGNIRISADRILIKDGAVITAAGEATGSSGNLDILSRFLKLENGGEITAFSRSTTGGNINLQAEDLRILNQGSISASAAQFGNGGNLNINAQTIVALDSSSLNATAFEGRGGNVQINTQGLFRTAESSISASSLLGIDGIVDIKTPELNLHNSLAPIAITFTNPNSLIADSCLTRRNGSKGSFVITGTGGLPRSPYDDKVASRYNVAGLQGQPVGLDRETNQNYRSNIYTASTQAQAEIPTSRSAKHPIQEAQNLTISPDGRILLTTLPQQDKINRENLVCY